MRKKKPPESLKRPKICPYLDTQVLTGHNALTCLYIKEEIKSNPVLSKPCLDKANFPKQLLSFPLVKETGRKYDAESIPRPRAATMSYEEEEEKKNGQFCVYLEL